MTLWYACPTGQDLLSNLSGDWCSAEDTQRRTVPAHLAVQVYVAHVHIHAIFDTSSASVNTDITAILYSDSLMTLRESEYVKWIDILGQRMGRYSKSSEPTYASRMCQLYCTLSLSAKNHPTRKMWKWFLVWWCLLGGIPFLQTAYLLVWHWDISSSVLSADALHLCQQTQPHYYLSVVGGRFHIPHLTPFAQEALCQISSHQDCQRTSLHMMLNCWISSPCLHCYLLRSFLTCPTQFQNCWE